MMTNSHKIVACLMLKSKALLASFCFHEGYNVYLYKGSPVTHCIDNGSPVTHFIDPPFIFRNSIIPRIRSFEFVQHVYKKDGKFTKRSSGPVCRFGAIMYVGGYVRSERENLRCAILRCYRNTFWRNDIGVA